MRTAFTVVIWVAISLLMGWGLLMMSVAPWLAKGEVLATLYLRGDSHGPIAASLSPAIPLALAGALAVWARRE